MRRPTSPLLRRICDELGDRVRDEVQHGSRKTWKDSDPKRPVHDDVGVGEIADNPELDVSVSRLLREVAGE